MSTTSTPSNCPEAVVGTPPPTATGHEATSAVAEAHPAHGGLWEWLTRRQALRAAQGAQREGSSDTHGLLDRAREIAAVADRLFDAVEPVSFGTAQALAADLYRQSTLWSLAARAPAELRGAPPEELWEASRARELLALPQEPGERDALERVIRNHHFRSFELPEKERRSLAGALRTLAQSALDLGAPGDQAIRALLFQRFVRSFAAFVLIAVFGALAFVAAQYLGQKQNLAAGKPWRTSSVWAACQPEIRTCGGVHSSIFFHTREDAQPWIEFDLLTVTTFSEVYVKNRTDSMPDRAVPLVVEVSDDAKTWRPVARRDDTFRTWTASFAPVTARYVRLRVDRRSYLHLEVIEIHA